ncbi:hypothetical protein LLH00_01580 [bacterium]|nr:hypothetical protein [bacterium]
MFITLLAVTFVVSLGVSLIVSRLFRDSIRRILSRIIQDEIASSWVRYIHFAILVVGVSSGVRVYDLQQYVLPRETKEGFEAALPALTTERWVLEVYRTVIGTASGVAWMLLVFFVFALIAYVIVRVFESRKAG